MDAKKSRKALSDQEYQSTKDTVDTNQDRNGITLESEVKPGKVCIQFSD